jgi:predicted short-subunit dehydrogenase-like oxidoreductase (DUF2520 family)
MKIVLIGAGNLATCLALEMHRAGMVIAQVYSRTEEHAKSLAAKLGCPPASSLADIRDDAGLYIFAVKDSALEEVLSQMKPNKGLWIHTAGSLPMEIFAPYTERYGVFYPLQTFSKGRPVSFGSIPVFLEARSEEDGTILQHIATALSERVQFLPSEKRKYLHLAAVFACNFSNHMYAIAADILEEQHIPHNVLLPLIDETAAKVHDMPPLQAQTGPAVRYDENVIGRQAEMLDKASRKEIYLLLSQSIHKQSPHE